MATTPPISPARQCASCGNALPVGRTGCPGCPGEIEVVADSPAPVAATTPRMSRWLHGDGAAGLVLAVLVVIGLGLVLMSSRTSSGPATTATSPAAGSLACTHWVNVRADVAAGVLTAPELRAKLVEVRDLAPNAPTYGAATRMLAGVTADSGVAAVAGMNDLNQACQ